MRTQASESPWQRLERGQFCSFISYPVCGCLRLDVWGASAVAPPPQLSFPLLGSSSWRLQPCGSWEPGVSATSWDKNLSSTDFELRILIEREATGKGCFLTLEGGIPHLASTLKETDQQRQRNSHCHSSCKSFSWQSEVAGIPCNMKSPLVPGSQEPGKAALLPGRSPFTSLVGGVSAAGPPGGRGCRGQARPSLPGVGEGKPARPAHLVVLLAGPCGRAAHQHLHKGRAVVPDVHAVYLLLLLKL